MYGMNLSSLRTQLAEYITVDPVVAISIFLLGLIVSVILYAKLDTVLNSITDYLGVDYTPSTDQFGIPIAITFGIFLGWLGLEFVTIKPSTRSTILSILFTLIILTWMRTVIRLGKITMKKIISSKYDEDMAPIVGNVWSFLVLMASIGGILSVWKINITPLLASAGVLGVVAGLAARDTIANFFGSISLYADETYRKGDFIELSDETRGIVWDVSIRSTQIQTLDGDIITVPNSKLNNTIVRNKAQPNDSFRIRIPFGVTYDADPAKVKKLALELVEDHSKIQSQPQPQIHLREFGDSALEFEIICYISHPRQKIFVEDKINTALYKRLAEEDIEIPYPQRDVHLREKD